MIIVNHILACRFFDDGRCEIRCQKGRYAMGRQCHLCHHTCQECTDEGPDSCTSCDRGTLTWVKNHSDDFFSPNSIIKSMFSSKDLCICKSELSQHTGYSRTVSDVWTTSTSAVFCLMKPARSQPSEWHRWLFADVHWCWLKTSIYLAVTGV